MLLPDLVLTSRRALVEGAVRPAAVAVRGGTILAVAEAPLPEWAGAPVEDLGDDVLLPGLVDTHVHINEPGRTHWEGFETATRAAAAGGVTTLVDMPLNSIPPSTTPAGLAAKQAAAREKVWVDVGFCGGLVADNEGELRGVFGQGALAFKSFLAPSGVDEFPHVREPELARGLAELGAMGVPLLLHAELPGPLEAAEAALAGADPLRHDTWLRSRPPAAELEAVELTFALARRTGARAHIVHLSAAGALGLVARARAEGVALTVETCPHYLSFAAETIPDRAPAFKCAPPIREAANREALWEGLRAGLISQVVTDHSPADPGLKCVDSGDFVKAWGGIASLQLGLAATWTGASARGFGIADLGRWMSEAPAALVGLSHRKGRIAPGLDADLVAWRPEEAFVVDPARLFHRHPVTPYAGAPLRGRVYATWLRGRCVYRDGAHLDRPSGELLRSPA